MQMTVVHPGLDNWLLTASCVRRPPAKQPNSCRLAVPVLPARATASVIISRRNSGYYNKCSLSWTEQGTSYP
ncbi:hypothetical protein J6590_014256 [Homalodisca vitripennis]|nr:hypothetical protein J6590_014256 [Homalodisca vitripennis]